MITWERFEVTRRTLETNLSRMTLFNNNFETLICDQGSKDERIIKYIAERSPRYHRKNTMNEGVAHAFNQLFLRSQGEFICMMGNDIILPENWDKIAIEYINKVPNTGLVGFDWGHGGMPQITKKHSV